MIDNFNLPVSEELLGAYLEGNLSEEELANIRHAINSNDNLSSLINEASQNDINWSISIEDDYTLDQLDFELPIVHNEIDIEVSQLMSIDYPWDGKDMEESSPDAYHSDNIHSNLHNSSIENENLEECDGQNTNHANFDPADNGEISLDLDNL